MERGVAAFRKCGIVTIVPFNEEVIPESLFSYSEPFSTAQSHNSELNCSPGPENENGTDEVQMNSLLPSNPSSSPSSLPPSSTVYYNHIHHL